MTYSERTFSQNKQTMGCWDPHGHDCPMGWQEKNKINILNNIASINGIAHS